MIFVTSGDWEISSRTGVALMTFALELEREFRVAIDLSFFGLEGVPLERRPSELPFPLVIDGGGVELLDGKGVTVCFTDRVEARERVFVAPCVVIGVEFDAEPEGVIATALDLIGNPIISTLSICHKI
jgi:hypothetical protein